MPERREPRWRDPIGRVSEGLRDIGEETYRERQAYYDYEDYDFDAEDSFAPDPPEDFMGNNGHINEMVRNRVAHDVQGQVSVRFHGEDLPKILKSGRLLNQHATRTSSGLNNPDRRAEYERRAFGRGPMSKPERHHPVYGYMDNYNGGDDTLSEQYGDVRAVMKPHVENRTTVTSDDSLPRGVPIKLSDARKGNMPDAFIGAAMDVNGYTEAQIHGGVKLARDVHHLEFHRGRLHAKDAADFSDAFIAPQKKLATKHGVPWRELALESHEQQVLDNPPEHDDWDQKQIRRMDVWGDTPVRPDFRQEQVEVDKSPNFHVFFDRRKHG
jgi:hypothetical protein